MQNQSWGGSSLPFLAVGRVKEHRLIKSTVTMSLASLAAGEDSVTLAYYIDPESVEQQAFSECMHTVIPGYSHVEVASVCTVRCKEQTQEVFQKLLKASLHQHADSCCNPRFVKASSQKLAAGQRTRLQWNNGSVWTLSLQRVTVYAI